MSILSKLYQPLRISSKGSHKRIMPLIPIDWVGKKAIDDILFYMSLTGIPIILFITYQNIFVGQAELAEIPEDYTPKEYEYHKSPVSRLIIKNFGNYQRLHEKHMHFQNLQIDRMRWAYAWDLFNEIQDKYKDSKLAWYYPGDDKYAKSHVETDKFLDDQRGNDKGFFQ